MSTYASSAEFHIRRYTGGMERVGKPEVTEIEVYEEQNRFNFRPAFPISSQFCQTSVHFIIVD